MRSIFWAISLMLSLTAAQNVFADPCTAPLPSQGTDFSGRVRYVGDGDSLCVGQSSEPTTWIEVRVADFYAPNCTQRAAHRPKQRLKELLWAGWHDAQLAGDPMTASLLSALSKVSRSATA